MKAEGGTQADAEKNIGFTPGPEGNDDKQRILASKNKKEVPNNSGTSNITTENDYFFLVSVDFTPPKNV